MGGQGGGDGERGTGRWEWKGQSVIGCSLCTCCLVCCVRSLWERVYLRLEVARAGLAEVDHTFVACAAQSRAEAHRREQRACSVRGSACWR